MLLEAVQKAGAAVKLSTDCEPTCPSTVIEQLRLLCSFVDEVTSFEKFVATCSAKDLEGQEQYKPTDMVGESYAVMSQFEKEAFGAWELYLNIVVQELEGTAPEHWRAHAVDSMNAEWICENLFTGYLETIKDKYVRASTLRTAFVPTQAPPCVARVLERYKQAHKGVVLDDLVKVTDNTKLLSGLVRVHNTIMNKLPKAKDLSAKKQLIKYRKKHCRTRRSSFLSV